LAVIARLPPELKAARVEELRVSVPRDAFPSHSKQFLVVPSGKEVHVIGMKLNPLQAHYAAAKGGGERYALGIPEELAPHIESHLKNVYAGKQVRVLAAEAVERAVRKGKLDPDSHSNADLQRLLKHEELKETVLSDEAIRRLSAEMAVLKKAEAAIASAYSRQPLQAKQVERSIVRELKAHAPRAGQSVSAEKLLGMVRHATTKLVEEDRGMRPYGAKPYAAKEAKQKPVAKEEGEKMFLQLLEKEAGKKAEEKPTVKEEKPVRGLKEAREALKPEKEEKKVEAQPGKPSGERQSAEETRGKKIVGLSWISPGGLWKTPSSSRWLVIGAIVVFIIFLLMLAFS